VADAVRQFNELYDEWLRKAEEARGEIKEIFDDFFPLALSATADGFAWTDRKAGASGQGLQRLSVAFSPALVALYAMYAYGIPQETYLLVEEPEAHAHPLMVYFLGAYLRRLAKRSGGRLNVVVSTHSFDFLRGFWDEGVKVYVLRRFIEGGKVLLKVAGQWRGRAMCPASRTPSYTSSSAFVDMNCNNTLWIDAVRLYYIAQNFNLNIGKLIKIIAEETYP
jgi:hypothetical protein